MAIVIELESGITSALARDFNAIADALDRVQDGIEKVTERLIDLARALRNLKVPPVGTGTAPTCIPICDKVPPVCIPICDKVPNVCIPICDKVPPVCIPICPPDPNIKIPIADLDPAVKVPIATLDPKVCIPICPDDFKKCIPVCDLGSKCMPICEKCIPCCGGGDGKGGGKDKEPSDGWDWFNKKFGQLVETLKKAGEFIKAIDTIVKNFDELVNHIVKLVQDLSKIWEIVKLIRGLGGSWLTAILFALKTVSGLSGGGSKEEPEEKSKPESKEGKKGNESVWSRVYGPLWNGLKGIGHSLVKDAVSVWDQLKHVGESVVRHIVDPFKRVWDALKNAVSPASGPKHPMMASLNAASAPRHDAYLGALMANTSAMGDLRDLFRRLIGGSGAGTGAGQVWGDELWNRSAARAFGATV